MCIFMSGSNEEESRVMRGWRICPMTAKVLQSVAFNWGYRYGGKGSVGQLLDAIATGEVLLLRGKGSEVQVVQCNKTSRN